ncbi:FRG domain-containing protein [Aggregatibacter kilianii]|uniref:FRG domain-containing protein n=1 Tax=Aggregatibacter kilianii TaxID=2025884 RepID=UPI000D65B132|nr:FRG domain-containing protein [Aggregatibacter kilianii]
MPKLTNLKELPFIDKRKPLFKQKFQIEKFDDGLVGYSQCIKIRTLQQLEYLLKEIYANEKQDEGFIYRGQADSNWKLESTFQRETKGKCIDPYFHHENFRQLARGRLSEQSLLRKTQETEYINELWAVGQHLGLKTPLLDWTTNFYVALFFAFEKEKKVKYRAVYRTHMKFFNVGGSYVSECFVPYADPIGRISAQQGLFITQQGIETLENKIRTEEDHLKKVLCSTKFYIANTLRDEILVYLKHIGIKFETIYPDIQGAILEANERLKKDIERAKPYPRD